MYNCHVSIDRGPGNVQQFEGAVIRRTTSHALVRHKQNPEVGEWFAFNSAVVHVHEYGDEHNGSSRKGK